MKFFVNIEETINGIFEVEANSTDEAFEIARQKYYDCEFVNSSGDLTFVQASVMADNGEFEEWSEF